MVFVAFFCHTFFHFLLSFWHYWSVLRNTRTVNNPPWLRGISSPTYYLHRQMFTTHKSPIFLCCEMINSICSDWSRPWMLLWALSLDSWSSDDWCGLNRLDAWAALTGRTHLTLILNTKFSLIWLISNGEPVLKKHIRCTGIIEKVLCGQQFRSLEPSWYLLPTSHDMPPNMQLRMNWFLLKFVFCFCFPFVVVGFSLNDLSLHWWHFFVSGSLLLYTFEKQETFFMAC